jgi:hypothetical protein
MPGDNLHLIAGYHYGDARLWDRIWQANRNQIRNPNVIERGIFLLIPNAATPDMPYAEFAALARRSGTFAAAIAKAGGPTAPEVEVRIMGEKPATPPSAGEAPAPAEGSAATPAPPAGQAGR